ncbi:MAG: hydantoinase B/oxoprolinase family protein, partial [Actinobacteria bacterium]|nr:hydantoinase B/oxoprolinase family protein [Actinomycetota bacterium]
LRENCVAGIPVHPYSCSVATTNVADRVVNVVQRVLAECGGGIGIAEGGLGRGPGTGVISGLDERGDPRPYVNQIFVTSIGGPATSVADGWIGYGKPATAGLLYSDSIEVDEQKYPILFEELRLLADTGGPGEHRGAPGSRVTFRPLAAPMRILYSADGTVNPPLGAAGGLPGASRQTWRTDAEGRREDAPIFGEIELQPGETVTDVSNGGGGYGEPRRRSADEVVADVNAGYVSPQAARDVYRVAVARGRSESWTLDADATERLRASAGPDGDHDQHSSAALLPG